MSTIPQRHLLDVLAREIEKISIDERPRNYSKDLKLHLSTILACEREHRTKNTNIRVKVADQIAALADVIVSKQNSAEGDAS